MQQIAQDKPVIVNHTRHRPGLTMDSNESKNPTIQCGIF
jgi:hypothetical protein